MSGFGGVQFDLGEAEKHLRAVDPVVAGLMDRHGPYQIVPREDPYHALLRAILFQQLAGAAANAIQKRFHAMFGDRPPTPEELIATSDDDLRTAGVSRQKASCMRDLAMRVHDGSLDLEHVRDLDDAEVAKQITAVKGLGEWSAHMFLMFHLGRPDVLPIGDLGVRSGMKIAYGLEEVPKPKQALEIGAKWAPFRSVGSWYMWRATEGRPSTPDI